MSASPAPRSAGVRPRGGDEMGDQDGPDADLEAEAGEQAGGDAGVGPAMGMQLAIRVCRPDPTPPGSAPAGSTSKTPIIPRSEWGTMWQWNTDLPGKSANRVRNVILPPSGEMETVSR